MLWSLIASTLNIITAIISETLLTYCFSKFVVWQHIRFVTARIICCVDRWWGGGRKAELRSRENEWSFLCQAASHPTFFFCFFLCHCPWSKTDRKEVGLLHQSSKNTSVPLCGVWDEATEIPRTAIFPLGSNISSPASVSAHYFCCRSPCFHPSLAPVMAGENVCSINFPLLLN